MGFWDAFVGKGSHWNNVKQDTHTKICKGLNAFVSAKTLGTVYDRPELVTKARDELYTFFTVSEAMVANDHWEEVHQQFLKESLRERVFKLDVRAYMTLVSVIHAEGTLLFYGINANKTAEHGQDQPPAWWFDRHLGLLLEGLCWMYSHPASFAGEWQHCRVWLEPNSPKQFAPALGHKVDDDISSILHTRISPIESQLRQIWWPTYWEFVFSELTNPDWLNTIQAQTTGHC